MLDNPYESEENILETLQVILEIQKPFQLQLYSLRFYQGTELYYRAKNEGIAI